ncbi:unnamed protein product (macronuclear) [Paramecium tetraurelia]|uniref:Sec1 family protein n=1 Tax=Paramecium tetraurelia TaxID=5888 RepID=A0E2R2_PARTE|nr:uncharacterized protein GSPATT00022751001 [Paramecium tetraurelia]CAK89579.1 unnamed protein product [Paramecium tetraurelia]|eukprot:XP_001456976.1 hypothetical protein (macronuclear) [Paramecium tetraurelia strain d4-2]
MEQAQFSLKEVCRQRMRNLFRQLRIDNQPNLSTSILVVDQKTLKIVSAYMKMSELLEQGINAVENLNLKRKPFNLEAIYFITPTQESVALLMEDFANAQFPQYKCAHVIFNNKMTQGIAQKMQSEQNLVKKLSTCKVFNLDFNCTNEQLFTFDMIFGLEVYKGRNVILQEMAEKICTVLVSFEKFYTFELIFRQDNWKICQQLAQFTQGRLREILEALKRSNSSQYDQKDKTCGKIRLVIVDRAIDVLSPLLHDFYYQPMFYDLLEIENDIYQYDMQQGDKKVSKKQLINDQDELFKKYKFKHIADVLEEVSSDFQTFMQTNTAAKVAKDKDQNLTLKQMTDIVKTMPQYQDLVAKYTMHMEIVEKCLDLYRQKDLQEVGELEQTLATGCDKKGSSVAGEKIIQRIFQVLKNPKLNEFDFARLILSAIIQIDVSEKDRRQLTDLLSVEMQSAVHNLKLLGIQTQNSGSKSHKRVNEQVRKYAKNKMANETLELCRNTPIIEQQIEDLILKDFQTSGNFEKIVLNEQTNAQGQGKSLRQKGQIKLMQDDVGFDEQDKLLVFVVGGIGYNEARSLMNNKVINKNLVIGSTFILRPNDYVKELVKLQKL